MFLSQHNTRSCLSDHDGIDARTGMTSIGQLSEQAQTVSALNRQHASAISRLLSVMNLTRKTVTDAGPRPRLRDTCKAKAEILLTPEETEALRSQMITPKGA